MSYSLLWSSVNIKLYLIPMVQTPMAGDLCFRPMAGALCPRPLWLRPLCLKHLWLETYVRMLGTSLLFWYNKLVWRPMVSDTVYVPRGRSRISSWGEGWHIWENCAEAGAKIFGLFCVKNHDFTPKNNIFSNFRGVRDPPVTYPGSAYKTTTNHETTQTPTGTWTRDLASHRLI